MIAFYAGREHLGVIQRALLRTTPTLVHLIAPGCQRLRIHALVQAIAGSLIYLVGTRCFSSSLQFNTTVKGTDALGPTGVTRRNRLPSAVTSPTTAPVGA